MKPVAKPDRLPFSEPSEFLQGAAPVTIEPTPTSNALIARVKGILLKPNLEWPIIDAEPATVKGLFTG